MDTQTASHVRLLSTFHFVLAGLAVVGSFFPALYVAMGWALLAGTFPGHSGATPPPPQLGWVFVGIGVVLMLAGFAYAALLLLAGRFLARRRHWTACVVIAAISCAFFPFGTVLGVLTIVTLVKPEVKLAFEGARPPAPPPPPHVAGA
jgi:hypothetical protein